MRSGCNSLRVFVLLGALVLAPLVAAAAVATKDAAKFVGTWALSFEGPMGPISLGLAVTDAAGSIAAKVDATEFAATPVTEIAKEGDNLALKFSIDAQGMTLPVKLTLTPDGDKLKVVFDVADGMFSLPGTGAKK